MTARLPNPIDATPLAEGGLPPAVDAPEFGELPAGTVVAGRYRLESVLGKGGMGVVYSAKHLELDTKVALKILPSIYVRDPESLQRFEREARTACKVRHPNVVEVFDLGRLPSGEPYLVMEFLEGYDLDAALSRGPLSHELLRKVVSSMADALDALHGEGIVHRDVKPANVFFAKGTGGRETVKLVDFGLATSGKENARLTQVGHVIGTAAYLPPESARGDLAGPQGDIYSLAVMAFELLSGGALPFDGLPMAILLDKVSKPAPSLASITGREFPPALEAALAKGLQRVPAHRPASARALADELIAALDGVALPAKATRRGSVRPPAPTTDPLPATPTNNRGPMIAAALVALLLLIGGGAWYATMGGGATPTAAATEETPTEAPLVIPTPLPAAVAAVVEPTPVEPTPVEPTPPSGESTTVATAPSTGRSRPRTGGEPTSSSGAGTTSGASGASTGATSTGASITPTGGARTEGPSEPAETGPGGTEATESATARTATLLSDARSAMLHGEIPRARDLYREATLSSPRNAAAWRGLGLASERMGLNPEARTAYERYLSIAPNAADADTVRGRLEAL